LKKKICYFNIGYFDNHDYVGVIFVLFFLHKWFNWYLE